VDQWLRLARLGPRYSRTRHAAVAVGDAPTGTVCAETIHSIEVPARAEWWNHGMASRNGGASRRYTRGARGVTQACGCHWQWGATTGQLNVSWCSDRIARAAGVHEDRNSPFGIARQLLRELNLLEGCAHGRAGEPVLQHTLAGAVQQSSIGALSSGHMSASPHDPRARSARATSRRGHLAPGGPARECASHGPPCRRRVSFRHRRRRRRRPHLRAPAPSRYRPPLAPLPRP
jgi:hypothetical protein